MKPALILVAGVVVLLAAQNASAHRLDEYLQATTLSLEKDHIQAEIRLTPGVAVLPFVLASIDADGDGVLSASEQRAYAERVVHDLSLQLDGKRLRLQLVSTRFPGMQEMKEGLGEIVIEFAADVSGYGRERKLVFENHHQSRIAAYLVNCLVPRDPDLRVTGQSRNYQQSFYRLDYVQAAVRSNPLSFTWWRGYAWLVILGILLVARLTILWRQRQATARWQCVNAGLNFDLEQPNAAFEADRAKRING
jgi:hypothetical protein